MIDNSQDDISRLYGLIEKWSDTDSDHVCSVFEGTIDLCHFWGKDQSKKDYLTYLSRFGEKGLNYVSTRLALYGFDTNNIDLFTINDQLKQNLRHFFNDNKDESKFIFPHWIVQNFLKNQFPYILQVVTQKRNTKKN